MPRVTPNLNLFVPDPGQSGIAAELNSNYDAIDGTMDPVGGHKHTGAPGAAPKIAVANIAATGTPDATTYLRGDGQWTVGSGGSSGVTDHGALTGLTDDDHPQYHTQPRGDARWLQRANNLSDIANAAAARTALDAAQTAHNHAAADVSSGVMAPARLGAGAASSSTYLRGDGQWATVAGTGVGGSGVAGRAAFWSAVSTLSGIANSIFFNTTTGFLGIGMETPEAFIHSRIITSNPPSYTDYNDNAPGATEVHQVELSGVPVSTSGVSFDLKFDPTSSVFARSYNALRALAVVPPTNTTVQTTTPILRAVSGTARFRGLSAWYRLIGVNGVVTNQSTNGSAVAQADGLAGQVVNNGTASVVTAGAALRAERPTSVAGSTITNQYGLYLEQQRPIVGSIGASYGVYQEGTLDQNTYKGPSQFDGKASFASQPAGIEKLFGWYDETLPTAATLGPTYPVTHDLTLVRSEGWAEIVATGAAAQFDIQYKRGGGAWTSVFSTLPQFAVGANQRTTGTLSVTTLNAGDFVRRRWIGTPATIADVSTYLVAVTR